MLAVPAVGAADRGQTVAGLQAQNASLAAQSRTAVLDLYSLDAQLANAQAHLDALRTREAALETRRSTLKVELHFARVDAHLSQVRLASRIRFLYDHGTTSTIALFFGARTLEDAVSELDDIDRVAALNDDVLIEVRASESRLTVLTRRLAREQSTLDTATRQAVAITAQLAQTRAARSAFVARLASQRSANLTTIAGLEAQAQAAEARSQQLPVQTLTPTALATAVTTAPAAPAAPALPAVTGGGRMLTVTSTGYALPGHTATGLPVGYGVVAVDPSVIPLGTHLIVPGYGEAVAADTGGAVIGDTIDLWFPSLAQAQAWGRRSITIELQ
jgi:3D (Asp-Asp-Asp) domain-containing protein